jgi:DNA-binding response OmpR family regulator
MSAVRRQTVLVMDDSPIVLDVVRASLEAEGFDVFTAANLDELETARAAHPPDLVLLDVQMPEMFGDDVGEVLRNVKDVHVPILLFSSLDEELLAKRTREAQLDGFVTKRAGVKALCARVKGILETGGAPR